MKVIPGQRCEIPRNPREGPVLQDAQIDGGGDEQKRRTEEEWERGRFLPNKIHANGEDKASICSHTRVQKVLCSLFEKCRYFSFSKEMSNLLEEPKGMP